METKTEGNNNLEDIKNSILKVLKNDPKTMPLNILMHKVFKDLKNTRQDSSEYVPVREFNFVLEGLMEKHLVGRNRFGKYFIDYLDYEENGIEGEGYIEIDVKSGNGYITIKSHPNEYKKSSYFVHKKNLGESKTGDYVRFVELKITDKKQFNKFSLIDARVKEVLPDPNNS